jgi:hypothetical protein
MLESQYSYIYSSTRGKLQVNNPLSYLPHVCKDRNSLDKHIEAWILLINGKFTLYNPTLVLWLDGLNKDLFKI